MKKHFTLFILIISLLSCRKDNETSKNVAILDFKFSSIYNIDQIQIDVFQGWIVTNGNFNINDYYSIANSHSNELKIELEPGPYTIVVNYKDFQVSFREKYDLKKGINQIGMEYNKPISVALRINSIIYNENEPIYLNFQNSMFKKNIGLQSVLTLNGKEFDQIEPNKYTNKYNRKIDANITGMNDLELKINYPNGLSDSYKYKILVSPDNSIENVWNNINEEYLNQEIFQHGTAALRNDLIYHDGTIIPKKTVIKNLFGEYKFIFNNKQLNMIDVIHGNMNRDATLRFDIIKDELDKHFSEPKRNGYDDYTYDLGLFEINLHTDNSSNVISRITKK